MVVKLLIKLQNSREVSPQHIWKTVENETKNTGFHREVPKERYISPEKTHKIAYGLRLI